MLHYLILNILLIRIQIVCIRTQIYVANIIETQKLIEVYKRTSAGQYFHLTNSNIYYISLVESFRPSFHQVLNSFIPKWLQ